MVTKDEIHNEFTKIMEIWENTLKFIKSVDPVAENEIRQFIKHCYDTKDIHTQIIQDLGVCFFYFYFFIFIFIFFFVCHTHPIHSYTQHTHTQPHTHTTKKKATKYPNDLTHTYKHYLIREFTKKFKKCVQAGINSFSIFLFYFILFFLELRIAAFL